MKKLIMLLFITLFMVSCSGEDNVNSSLKGLPITTMESSTSNSEKIDLSTNNEEKMIHKYSEGEIIAVMKTTNGVISMLLEMDKAPVTSANFIGLSKKGYYDGVIFHRIIKGFMIQGGDPEGTGMGGVSIYGESFEDEFSSDLKNNKYTVSMANSGPNTNGSQFFINTVNNNFLDNKHSVFARVIEGFSNVDKIEKVKTGTNDKPEKDVKIISIEIKEYRDGGLKDYEFDLESTIKKIEDDKKMKKEAKKDKKVESGDTAFVHYTGTFENGEVFDSSVGKEPIKFEIGAGQMIKGFNDGVVGMKIGDKKTLTLSPADSYGERDDANKQVIPKTDLVSFTDTGVKLEVGVKLPTQIGELEIIAVDEETVTIDGNHPMAGKTLIFDIELIDIK